MDSSKYVAVPIDLMNQILNYLAEQKYKEVHSLVERISQECTSIDNFSQKEDSEES